MPSLFERFGRSLTRKKTDELLPKSSEKPSSAPTEPNGKHNQISTPDARPGATEFPSAQEKPNPRQKRFSRAKSPSARPVPTPRVPVLSLHLPELRDAAVAKAQRLTFEAIAEDPQFTSGAIAKRRLTPPEAVYLAKQTSGALHGKGLATLGIFKPHWHSASQDQQHKLINLFLQSIANSTTLPPSPGASLEKFEAHLQTASPHDVADVLKWGLRHLQLENQSFPTATSSDEWGWYKVFAEAERAAGFPPNAYTDLLLPLLPPAHQELLSTFLDIGTSVAAHAETNGVSGSKLTRLVGWWLLSQRNPASNGLVGFIQEWETAARILEHIYLAYIRDHTQAGKMPKRLTQLVKSYPYPKQASPMDQHFLPRPKFTTRRRTALLVRLFSVSRETTTYRNDPIQLLKDALHADVDKDNSPKELLDVWEELRVQANHGTTAEEGTPAAATLTLSTLLTEEAIRLLTSTSDEPVTLPPPSSPVALSQTSLPLAQSTTGGTTSGTSRAPSDWDGFTNAGFEFMGGLNLAGGLQDYVSPPTSPGKTKRRSLELGRRSSLNAKGAKPPHNGATTEAAAGAGAGAKPSIASTLLLDEALIDGWADTLNDPIISSAWPTFVLYQLKAPLADPTAAANESETRDQDDPAPAGSIAWLVVETYAPTPPPTKRDGASAADGKEKEKYKARRSSSKPRFGGFFSSSTSVATSKDKDKDKESKKKESGGVLGRRSSVGVLKEATKSQHSLANHPIAEEADVPAVPKASANHGTVIPSTAVTTVAAVATAGVIATVAEAKEEAEAAKAAGEEAASTGIEPAGDEPTTVTAEAIEEPTQSAALTVQPTSATDEDAARAESLGEEAEAARIEAESAARAQEEERLAAEKSMEEERIACESAAQAEAEQLQQRMEAERAAEEARVMALEDQRLAELAAKEEEERLALEAEERAAAQKALEEELAAKAEAERLERERAEEEARLEELRLQQLREAEEERLRLEAEEQERQAQLQREEEARQAEAARVEQERLEAEAPEKARLEEEEERERLRKEEEEREAARLEAIRIAEEKQREEEEAAESVSAPVPEPDEEEPVPAPEPVSEEYADGEGASEPIVESDTQAAAPAENEAGEEIPEVKPESVAGDA